MTGDGQITARVASVQNTDPWAMAGVMMRDTLAAGSRHADVSMTAGNGWSLTTRANPNGSSAYTAGGAGTAPAWVRLRRVGNVFTAWRSADGVAWTQFAQATIAMGSSIEVGLAVSAVDDTALATAAFTNVAVVTDLVAPGIAAVVAAPTGTSGALVTWSTTEAADGLVEYGLSTTYGSATPDETSLGTAHSRSITGLATATTYHYRVRSTDAAGNAAVSADATFRTAAAPDGTPPQPPSGLTARAVSPTQVILTWNAATDDVAVTGYQVLRDGTPLTPTTTATTATDGGLAPNSTHTWTVRAFDAAGNTSLDSTPATTTTPAAVSLMVDVDVVTSQSAAAATTTSPAFSTAGPDELLLAFVASDGPRTGSQRITAVTGGGLTWTLRTRVNGQAGVSEVWQAVARTKLTGVTVTATRASGSYQGMLAVVAFTGADLTTAGAAGGTSAARGAPSASVVTTKAGSWVWAVGNDWDGATARTVGSGQAKVHEFLSSRADTFWIQRLVGPTTAAGTTVTVNDTAPTNHRWDLAVVEVRSA